MGYFLPFKLDRIESRECYQRRKMKNRPLTTEFRLVNFLGLGKIQEALGRVGSPWQSFLRALVFAIFTTTNVFGTSPTPITEATGAPGHLTCAQCHSNTGGSGSVSLSFSGGTEYEPGGDYTLTVTISDPNINGRKAGFAMVARDESNNSIAVGTVGQWMVAGRNDVQQFGVGPDFQVGHKNASTATSTQKIYTVDWKAPAAGVGNVKFYVASVAAGSDPILQSDDHTYIYNGGFGISEAVIPQTRVVTTSGSSGAGSLRQAVADAVSGDTIVFAATLNGMIISLGGSQILLDKNLTIDASALPGGITISGGNLSRVFEVGFLVNVTLDSMTITGGDSNSLNGGGIYSFGGDLSIRNSTITGNAATNSSGGGIYQVGGSLTLENSSVSSNSSNFSGGGVFFSGTSLTVSNSTITNNSAIFDGGGINNNGGVLTIENSIISGNSGGNDDGLGGAIYTELGSTVINSSTLAGNTAFYGGGIYNTGGSLTIEGSTISGNTANERGGGIYNSTDISLATTLSNCTLTNNTATLAGGAIRNFEGATILNHCSVTGNTAPPGGGGGIASYGDVFTLTAISSTIVSGNINSDVDLADFVDNNSFTSNGFNLIGSGNATGAFILPGDIVGNTAPLLGPLCDNGGPTKTMRPLPGSPAINAGGTSVFTADQRGFSRTVGTAADIGAVETERVTFDLEWSGAGFGNNATAIGRITLDPSEVANPGNSWLNVLTDFIITVSGASSGNGAFDRSNFSPIIFETGGLALDFSTELLSQPTDSAPWGSSSGGGAFYFFGRIQVASAIGKVGMRPGAV
jgi:hypothetical protein